MMIFRNSIAPVLSKALLTGLAVAAIFSEPLQARENHGADRHVEQSLRSAIPRVEGSRWFAAPAAHAPASMSSDQPGGICDRGDDPMIC